MREVERRVQKLNAKADSLGNLPNAPLGAPDDFGELLDIQFEMIALACQTGQTRIATMRMVKEASMRTYPAVNVDEAFHPLSHHGEDPEKHARLVRIQAYHAERVNRFAKRLASIKEGDGNLLDNSIILFGSNMANSDLHNNNPLPQLLLGKGGGIKGGQHSGHAEGHAARQHPADHGAACRVEPREVRRLHRPSGETFDMRRGGMQIAALAVAGILAGIGAGLAPPTTAHGPMAARRCSGRSSTATSPRRSAC